MDSLEANTKRLNGFPGLYIVIHLICNNQSKDGFEVTYRDIQRLLTSSHLRVISSSRDFFLEL